MKSMKSKSLLTTIAVLVLLLSACGVKATPTVDPAFVQASAVAAANTMLAMTQAAMPTETLAPPTDTPTDTPQPAPVLPPVPTNPVLSIPVLPSPTAVAPSSSGGECGGPINASKGENLTAITINNKTNVLLGLSLYLNKNTWGDCGFWSSPAGIPPNSSITVTTLPANSCYHVTAWTLAGKSNFMNSNNFCVTINSAHYTLSVTTNGISLQ
jgi:hypothetical protein